jgi:hypothetical protein
MAATTMRYEERWRRGRGEEKHGKMSVTTCPRKYGTIA